MGVTRAKSHLIIARSISFARNDAENTPARQIAQTVQASTVLLPERLVIVESRHKAAPVRRALKHVAQVIATRGNIATVKGLDDQGDPEIEITPSAPYVSGHLDQARRWITPVDEGGFGLKTLVIATDADDAGEVIAHDILAFLGLSSDECQRRGLTVTRWPMVDPAALGQALAEDIMAARAFTPEITGRWRAVRERARTELRIAASRAIRNMLQAKHPTVDFPPLPVLRAMRWLDERERSGWSVHAKLRSADGREVEAALSSGPGRLRTFDAKAAAEEEANAIAVAATRVTRQPVPSPLRTRRSLCDVLSVLSWGGVPPLKAMKVLQVFFEQSARK